jgi:hypothetical protein
MSWCRPCDQGVILRLHVVPRSSRTQIAGRHGDALKIKLQAPPVDGKANKALCKFLARKARLPTSSVYLVSGESARAKQVMIECPNEAVRSSIMMPGFWLDASH